MRSKQDESHGVSAFRRLFAVTGLQRKVFHSNTGVPSALCVRVPKADIASAKSTTPKFDDFLNYDESKICKLNHQNTFFKTTKKKRERPKFLHFLKS
jgi:hypothetical protein